jgi:hypothetical protein
MRRRFESCGRDRHHYPHVTQLRPVEEVPYEPDEEFNLEQFEEIVCPGSGSDAMEDWRSGSPTPATGNA